MEKHDECLILFNVELYGRARVFRIANDSDLILYCGHDMMKYCGQFADVKRMDEALFFFYAYKSSRGYKKKKERMKEKKYVRKREGGASCIENGSPEPRERSDRRVANQTRCWMVHKSSSSLSFLYRRHCAAYTGLASGNG